MVRWAIAGFNTRSSVSVTLAEERWKESGNDADVIVCRIPLAFDCTCSFGCHLNCPLRKIEDKGIRPFAARQTADDR